LRVTVNGEAKELDEGTTLQGLVEGLALAPERIAAELNGEVVRRADWPAATLNEGDRVEVVHFVGGGSEG
jgi:sulfur carrier protein